MPLALTRCCVALIPLALSFALGGCTEVARQSVSAGMGPNPVLREPVKSLIPTVNIAPSRGWPVVISS